MSSASSSSTINLDKIASELTNLKIHIIQAKLQPQMVQDLVALGQAQGAIMNGDLRDADVIVTAINMKKRLERHLTPELAKRIPIVNAKWLRHSAKEGKRLPFSGEYLACAELPAPSVYFQNIISSTQTSITPGIDPSVPLSRFSTHRLSPLICPNQSLALELGIIRKARELEGDWRSALSYQRAIAAIEGKRNHFPVVWMIVDGLSLPAYPQRIESSGQVAEHHVPFIGPKILAKIDEFVTLSRIQEARSFSAIASGMKLATSGRDNF